MPSQPRYHLPGLPQHVIQRGNNRQPVFFSDADYRVYLACLHKAAEQHDAAVHAYVLMTNHVHLLITPQQTSSIAKLRQSLGRQYVYYSNTTYQRTGTLWEGRYKASVVEAERYFFTCSWYIECNPVRAGVVHEPAAYPWSSYRWHAQGEPDPVVTDHALYRALGRTPSARQWAYCAVFQSAFDAGALEEIRQALQQCHVLGSDCFKDALERTLQRRVRPGSPGRPRKRPHASQGQEALKNVEI
jgi:putative transposase